MMKACRRATNSEDSSKRESWSFRSYEHLLHLMRLDFSSVEPALWERVLNGFGWTFPIKVLTSVTGHRNPEEDLSLSGDQ